jgi:hypothetical protein
MPYLVGERGKFGVETLYAIRSAHRDQREPHSGDDASPKWTIFATR